MCAIIAALVTVVLGGVALKQIKEDTNEIEKKLRMQCEEKLTDYMRPIEYVFLKQMPLTSVGKVNYRALEQMAEENKAEPVEKSHDTKST